MTEIRDLSYCQYDENGVLSVVLLVFELANIYHLQSSE
jgi:hypothetical protein